MDLGAKIKKFVDTVLNKPSVQVIQFFPKAGSPPKPYATVKIPIQTGLGFPISEAVDQGGGQIDQLIAKPQIGDCEVIFYSNELSGEFTAQNLAEYFGTALGFDRAKQFQIDNDFGVLQVRPARDITLELGDLVEHRQIIEFSINYVSELSEANVDHFNQVETTLTVEE
jgi:hypothetical protein